MENRARLHNALINVIKYTDDYCAGKPVPRASGVIVLEDCGLGILSFEGAHSGGVHSGGVARSPTAAVHSRET